MLLLLLNLSHVQLILGGQHAWLSLKHPLELSHIDLPGRPINRRQNLLLRLHHLV